MQSLYVSRDHGALSLAGGQLGFDEIGPDGKPIPCCREKLRLAEISRVVVYGDAKASLPAILALADRGIPVYFVSAHGRWRGVLSPDRNLDAARRLRQYEHAFDRRFSRDASRAVVAAKLANARRTLQHLASNRTDSPAAAEARKTDAKLSSLVRRASNAWDIDAVRGYEGQGAALYFGALGAFFPADLPFLERSRRPPKDASNALLSFAYTMLLGEVESAVRCHGLDSAIGNLHRDRDGAPALALDLMEPFRPALCDRFVLDVVGHARIQSNRHFETRDGGVFLNEEGRRVFFGAWEQALIRPFAGPDGTRSDFRKEIDRTVCSYIHALEEGTPFAYYRLP